MTSGDAGPGASTGGGRASGTPASGGRTSSSRQPGDGDGFVVCLLGHRHWGRHGAAGLLLRWDAPGRGRRVLLARRPLWTHEGGTWAVPGGARDSDESAVQAALREAREEVGLEASGLDLVGSHHDDHGGWAYTTVVAVTVREPAVRPVSETEELRWVAQEDVPGLALHPGFRASWPSLLAV